MVMYPKGFSFRSEDYLSYIRTFPCCKCGSVFEVEAHHVSGILAQMGIDPGGLSSKAPDSHAVPLCRVCHDTHDHIGADTFWGTDNIEVIIIGFLTRFLVEIGVK